MQPVEKVSTHAGDYRAGLRSAVRGFWKGVLSRQQFTNTMLLTIERGQRFAFAEGAKLCGIRPDEYTDKELKRIQDAVDYEAQWIPGFGDAIEESRKAGGKLTPLFQRAEIWIGRYEGFKAEAQAMACGDKKLKWVQGPTSDHCSSCTKLNGKVKRGSWWYDNGILPRVHGAEYLECNGFRCLCTLVPTDELATKGRMPSLP